MKVDTAKTGMPQFANTPVSLDKMPTKPKSNTPAIFKHFQPSSLASTLEGTASAAHTRDFSSGVFPIKQYYAPKSTME